MRDRRQAMAALLAGSGVLRGQAAKTKPRKVRFLVADEKTPYDLE